MQASSEQINELAKALASAQLKMRPAVKNATNPHFKSNYADLAAIMEAAREAIGINGLSVIQSFTESKEDSVTVFTTLIHSSGQWFRSALTMKATANTPQGIGSAITYGRRYGLAAILGVVSDEEDDDGNGATGAAATPPVALPKAWGEWTLEQKGLNRANAGIQALQHWWNQLPVDARKGVKDTLEKEWKPIANKISEKKTGSSLPGLEDAP